MLSDIDKIKEHFDGDIELIGELIEVFESTYPSVMARLEEGVNSGDIEAVKLEAHTLKGMISNFFSEELKTSSSEIELNYNEYTNEEFHKRLLALKNGIPHMIKEVRSAKL